MRRAAALLAILLVSGLLRSTLSTLSFRGGQPSTGSNPDHGSAQSGAGNSLLDVGSRHSFGRRSRKGASLLSRHSQGVLQPPASPPAIAKRRAASVESLAGESPRTPHDEDSTDSLLRGALAVAQQLHKGTSPAAASDKKNGKHKPPCVGPLCGSDGLDHVGRENGAGGGAPDGLVLREVPLPGDVEVTHGSPLVRTSADLRLYLSPGTVLRLDGNLPCVVDGPMSASHFTISRPYPWKSRKKAPAASTNLHLVPGVLGFDAHPAAESFKLSGDPGVPATAVMPGDVLYLEAAGPVVVASAETPRGSSRSSAATAVVNVLEALPNATPAGAGIRLFRLHPPGADNAGSAVSGTPKEDAETVIDRVADEANSMFSSPIGDVGGTRLPGTVAATFRSAALVPSVDLRPFLSPGDVIKVGTRWPFVVARDPAMTVTSLSITSEYTGPTDPALPAYKTRLTLLPGSVSVVHGSDAVSTTADLRALLQASDVIVIDRTAGLIVADPPATVSAAGFRLAAPYPGRTASNVPIFLAGMHALPGTVSVTKDSPIVESTADLRKHLFLYDQVVFGQPVDPGSHGPASLIAVGSTSADAFTSSRFPLTRPYTLGPSATGLRLFRTGVKVLPGTVSVGNGSPSVSTTSDLRDFILPGDVIRIAAFPESVVAGGEYASLSTAKAAAMVTSSSFALTAQWAFDSGSNLNLFLTGFRRLPALVSTTRGERQAVTTTDVSDYIAPGALVRIDGFHRLAVAVPPSPLTGTSADEVVTARGFLLGHPYPGPGVTRVPLYLNTGALGGASSHRLDNIQSAEHALDGFVDTVHGSPYLKPSRDFSDYVRLGDVVRVGPVSGLVVAETPNANAIRLTVPFPGDTAKRLRMTKLTRRVKLSGTVSVTQKKPDALTSVDLRSELAVGDVVELEGREFAVVPPLTAKSFLLSEAYPGETASGLTAYKTIRGAGAGLLLPGLISVTHMLPTAMTTEDLSGSISAGDRLRIGLHEVFVTEPITKDGFSMTKAWDGTTARGLKAYNLGKSGRETSLEELAALKLQCRSIYCLAKIEEAERAIPSEFERSLNAGQAALKLLSADAAKKITAGRENVDEDQVEREWRKWYESAKSKLHHAAEPTEGEATKGAMARVKQLAAAGKLASAKV